MSQEFRYAETFDDYTVGVTPDGWTGSCAVTSGGYDSEGSTTPGLLIGSVGDINVIAPYPRPDYMVPKNSEDAWNIEFLLKLDSLDSYLSAAETPLTICTLGSMDREEKLKLQIVPGDSTCGTEVGAWYLQVYPYKTTHRVDDCRWNWIKIQVWDTYFNVYVNNSVTPFLQYGIPNFAPYWRAGDTRQRLTFPVSCYHTLIIDDYVFSTLMVTPDDIDYSTVCYAIRDSSNNPVTDAPVFLFPVTTPANQVTDAFGRFTVADVPENMDIFIVYPSLKSAIVVAADVALAKQRRLISGIDDYTNLVLDEDNEPVPGAKLYYMSGRDPSFYTDEYGKFPRTSVPSEYNVFIKASNGGTLYLDSSLFS